MINYFKNPISASTSQLQSANLGKNFQNSMYSLPPINKVAICFVAENTESCNTLRFLLYPGGWEAHSQ